MPFRDSMSVASAYGTGDGSADQVDRLVAESLLKRATDLAQLGDDNSG